MTQIKNSIRHIEIGGISFCGSTVLNLILGSLPNVSAIGESHWLIDSITRDQIDSLEKRELQDSFAEHSISAEEKQSVEKGIVKSISNCSPKEYKSLFMQCCFCTLESNICPHYNRNFRTILQKSSYEVKYIRNNNESWRGEIRQKEYHEKIANQLQTKIIVTSDKRPETIRRLDYKLNNDTIVLFKHPFNALKSYQKRGLSERSCRQSYLDCHNTFLHNYNNKGKLFFLQWEDFMEMPEKHLEFLCNNLELKYDKNALTPGWDILKDFHYMSNKAKRFLKLDSAYKEDHNTEEHKKYLEDKDNELLKNIYQKLNEVKIKIDEVNDD